MAVPVLQSRRAWYCPNCPAKDYTTEAQPHTRFHACPGLRGFTSPMIEVGVRAKVEAIVREDYEGRDEAQRDDTGRPIMAVVTTRDDGIDSAVFPSTAYGIGY